MDGLVDDIPKFFGEPVPLSPGEHVFNVQFSPGQRCGLQIVSDIADVHPGGKAYIFDNPFSDRDFKFQVDCNYHTIECPPVRSKISDLLEVACDMQCKSNYLIRLDGTSSVVLKPLDIYQGSTPKCVISHSAKVPSTAMM
jgi:hypothetical protein